MVIELGANDGLRGLDPASTKYNLENILLVLERHGINVLLTGMLAPPNLGKEYGIEFNQVYKNISLDEIFFSYDEDVFSHLKNEIYKDNVEI